MRKVFKIIGGGVVGLAVLALAAAGFVYWKSGAMLEQRFQVAVATPTIPTEAAAIERGRHLATTRGCLECHGADLAGAKVVDDPAMGKLYGPNITRGQGGLAAGYGDQDFERAIRHGVDTDGRGLFLMPSTDYAHFSAEDMGALIAYVKSVPPVDRASVPLSVGPVARALMLAGKIKLAANVIDHAQLRPAVITPGVTADYGQYVAISCTGCHGSNYAGGPIDIGPPDWPPAANLTPHAAGAVSTWTEENFIAALRTGKRPDGSEISPVMPRVFGLMNDTELQAIWKYLRTLPAVPTGVR